MTTAADRERLLRKAFIGVGKEYPDNPDAMRLLLNRRNNDMVNERYRDALDAALATERRVTVRRMRERLAQLWHDLEVTDSDFDCPQVDYDATAALVIAAFDADSR